jgi:hypothetical protein
VSKVDGPPVRTVGDLADLNSEDRNGLIERLADHSLVPARALDRPTVERAVAINRAVAGSWVLDRTGGPGAAFLPPDDRPVAELQVKVGRGQDVGVDLVGLLRSRQ